MFFIDSSMCCSCSCWGKKELTGEEAMGKTTIFFGSEEIR
jgi:hypothetical protein